MPALSGSSHSAFLAFISDGPSSEALREFAQKNNWPAECVRQGDIRTAAHYLKDHPAPEVLLVEIGNAEEAPDQLDALADTCPPDVKVMVTGSINEYSFYCWLSEIGIAGYVLSPFTAQAFETAFSRATSTGSANAPAKEATKLIAVLGTRGGAGATTLSVNLAALFAGEYGKPAALIDLDPQFGSVAMMLDLDPSRGLRDALEKPDRIDPLFLDRVMVKYDERLSVLSAEEPLEDMITVNEAAAEALLSHTASKFGVIVVDLPSRLHGAARSVLKRADHVLLATELSLTGLRDAMRLMDYFRDTLKIAPPMLIGSRVGALGKQELPIPNFEKGIGGKIAFQIPYSQDAFAALGEGEVLVRKARQSPISQAYAAIAHAILPLKKTKAAAAKKATPFGALSRLIHKKKA